MASGLAYGEIKVIKKNTSASTFINLPEYNETENKHMDLSAVHGTDGYPKSPPMSVLGHCRYKTKGTELNNVNNHPIVRSDVVGVHNGCISNDDELFGDYAKMFGRNGEVDSEIIFALIEYFSKAREMPVHKAIQEMAKLVRGSLACAMVHRMHPHIIWLFRRNNPCDVVLFKDIGLLAWSSSLTYVKNAMMPMGINSKDCKEIIIPPNSGVGIDLHRNIIHSFKMEEQDYLCAY
jgi:hypothetical protein